MLKFFLSAVLCTLSIEADVLEFYKNTLQTLEYKKTYSLYEQANTLQKDGISLNRFLNFSLDADYTDTKAKLLADSFHTSNITLRDTIDIFDKSTYKLEELMLDTKAQKTLLDIASRSSID